jgi:hypothetical protein
VTSKSQRYSAHSLFEQLDGQHFERFDDLQQAVHALFSQHLADFPVGYDYEDAIKLAERRGWLTPENLGVSVHVTQTVA